MSLVQLTRLPMTAHDPAPIIQIRRMLMLRSSRGVSLGYFWVLISGFLLWVACGSIMGDVRTEYLAALSAACLIGVAMWLRP